MLKRYVSVVVFSFIFALCSCSNKEHLSGKRERINFLYDNFLLKSKNGKIKFSGIINDFNSCDQYNFLSSNCVGMLNCGRVNKKRSWYVKFLSQGTRNAHVMTNVLVDYSVINGKESRHVFVADASGNIYSIDFFSGNIDWILRTSNKVSPGGTYMCICGARKNLLYIVTSFSEMIVCDKKDGRIIYRKNLPHPAKGPILFDKDRNSVYVLSDNSSLTAFSADNCELLWQHTGMFRDYGIIGLPKPALFDDIVIVPYRTGEVFALNQASGDLVWEIFTTNGNTNSALSSFSDIKASPVVFDDKCVLVSNSGNMVCVDVKFGNVLWESNICGGIETPAVDGNVIFVINNNSDLLALNVADGKMFWTKNLDTFLCDDNVAEKWYGPVITSEGLVVCNSFGDIFYLDFYDGHVLRKYNIGKRIMLAPVFIKGAILIVSDSGIELLK